MVGIRLIESTYLLMHNNIFFVRKYYYLFKYYLRIIIIFCKLLKNIIKLLIKLKYSCASAHTISKFHITYYINIQ